MALRSLVKISSVNNLSDARYAAGMGVELMGFDLEEGSENYVSPEQFAALTGWISGVKLVGEINMESQEKLSGLLDQYQLDYVQINNPSSEFDIPQSPLPLIVKMDQADKTHMIEVLQLFATKTTWFLIDTPEPLSDTLLDWCKQLAQDYPIIIGTNVRPDNVLDLIGSGFRGIALKGGHEIKPGFKEFDALADVLEVLEIEN